MIALYLLKVTLCSTFLYAYYFLALRNRIFHQYNRFFLLAAVLFSLAFPLLPAPWAEPGGSGTDALSLYRKFYSSQGSDVVVTSNNTTQYYWYVVRVVYAGVSLVLLIRLLLGLWQLRRLANSGKASRLGPVRFVATNHRQAPFSFFNWLFWKQDIDPESPDGQSVLNHELVHIREYHSFDKMLMQLVLLACWINPVFWVIRRELHLIHEFIADRKAVPNGSVETLTAMILQSVYGNQYSKLVNPFFQQPVKRRIAMLQKALQQPRTAWLGRVMALPLCTVLLFAFAQPTKTPASGAAQPSIRPWQDTLPIKDAQNVKEVHYEKKDSITQITVIYKDGKKATYQQKTSEIENQQNGPAPLVVLDGKVVDDVQAKGGMDKLIAPENIESVQVWKGEQAKAKYGDKGRNGVVEITTRKAAGTQPVFTEVEQAPRFPGGISAWRRFLETNLKASVPVDKGAPGGTYTTITEIQVAADGTVSNIRPLTNHGYGMEEEVQRAMALMPKWEPAKQNGKTVTAIHKQPVTFVIAKEDQENAPDEEALLVIDGKVKGKMKDFSGNKFLVKQELIKSMNVLKDKQATDKYGDKGKNGVIEITTKQ